MSWHIF